MTHDAFNALLLRRQELSRAVLAAKSAEYSAGGDKLHNFKRAAAMLGVTPAQALIGMWAKHLISILDIVDANARGVKVTQAVLDEKIGDSVNYQHLLEAVLLEQSTQPAGDSIPLR